MDRKKPSVITWLTFILWLLRKHQLLLRSLLMIFALAEFAYQVGCDVYGQAPCSLTHCEQQHKLGRCNRHCCVITNKGVVLQHRCESTHYEHYRLGKAESCSESEMSPEEQDNHDVECQHCQRDVERNALPVNLFHTFSF